MLRVLRVSVRPNQFQVSMKPMLTARQFTVHSPTPTVPSCLPACLSLPTVAPFACAAAAAVAVASIKVSGAHRVELQLELELASPIKSYVSLHVTHVTMDMYVCVCVCVYYVYVGARPPTWPPLCISLLLLVNCLHVSLCWQNVYTTLN